MTAAGSSSREISRAMGICKNTVRRVLKRSDKHNLIIRNQGKAHNIYFWIHQWYHNIHENNKNNKIDRILDNYYKQLELFEEIELTFSSVKMKKARPKFIRIGALNQYMSMEEFAKKANQYLRQ